MLCLLVATMASTPDSPGLSLLRRSLALITPYAFLRLMGTANMMTELWRLSTAFIVAFRHGGRDGSDPNAVVANANYLHCFCRSLTPLRFAIGGFYHMEQEARMTLASFLATGTANLLIAFK